MRLQLFSFLIGIAWLGSSTREARAWELPPEPWPLKVETSDGISIQIHRPQIDSFEGNFLSFRTAVSIESKDNPSRFGALWLDARVQTGRAQQLARLRDLKISNLRMPDGLSISAEEVQTALNAKNVLIPLKSLVPAANRAQQRAAETSGLPVAAPSIVVVNEPTVLVSFSEEPRVIKIQGTNLMRVVDSPYLIVLNTSSRLYYLHCPGGWYSSTNVKGPYSPDTKIPASIEKLAPASSAAPAYPKIITATTPTELVLIDGPERFVAVPGTNLLRVENTESPLFLSIETRELYLLTGGRWLSSPKIEGPWKFVPATELPADFALIPSNFSKPEVLSSIIGTAENAETILNYQIAQTAAIKASERISLVEYDGQPDFRPIEGIGIDVAVNTQHDVIKVLGRYYACYEGVWYVSDTAIGPFQVTGTIPAAIYSIPPSSQVYHTTFVHAFSGEINGAIWFGYYPGYLGSYLSNGTVVWGTGYTYPPWVGTRYFARTATWGFAPRFNPKAATWQFGAGQALTVDWFAVNEHESAKWWGVGTYEQDGNDSNLYLKTPDRLGISYLKNPNESLPESVKSASPILIVDDTGYVNKRDFGGYQRWEAGNWVRVTDPEQEKALDRVARDLE